jgi:hypothetical protein
MCKFCLPKRSKLNDKRLVSGFLKIPPSVRRWEEREQLFSASTSAAFLSARIFIFHETISRRGSNLRAALDFSLNLISKFIRGACARDVAWLRLELL